MSKDSNSFLIIAGEKSGEEHLMSFFKDLKTKLSDFDFYGVGGDDLKKENVDLLYHLNDFSSWGYSEVFSKIPFYINAKKRIVEEAVKRNTKYALLVDFQTFNMSLAKSLTEAGVKVFYLVAPQAWAWKEYRVKNLARDTYKLFTIIPFEKKWFQDRGVEQTLSVPHPLVLGQKENLLNLKKEAIGDQVKRMEDSIRILLLPGSRNFEVKELLGDFVKSLGVLKQKNIEVGIVKSSSVNQGLYEVANSVVTKEFTNEDLHKALEWADISLAASGTVTLSCALFQVPTIVNYKVSLLNEWIFYTFVNYNGFISLANVVHEEMIFPEIMQDQVSPYNISKALSDWSNDLENFSKCRKRLMETSKTLAGEIEDMATFISEDIQGESNA